MRIDSWIRWSDAVTRPLILLLGLAVRAVLVAAPAQARDGHPYTLVDLGTLGAPQLTLPRCGAGRHRAGHSSGGTARSTISGRSAGRSRQSAATTLSTIMATSSGRATCRAISPSTRSCGMAAACSTSGHWAEIWVVPTRSTTAVRSSALEIAPSGRTWPPAAREGLGRGPPQLSGQRLPPPRPAPSRGARRGSL